MVSTSPTWETSETNEPAHDRPHIAERVTP